MEDEDRCATAQSFTRSSALVQPPRLSLSDRVVTILKRFILSERLEAGARIPPERQLADTLNVSRTVLREALSRMMGEGWLRRTSPRVLVVGDFDRASVNLSPIDTQEAEFQDLMELRIFIEIGAIQTIVQRATSAQLQEIRRWVVEGERRFQSGEPIHLADARFHTALLKAADNMAINSMLPLVEEQLRTFLLFDPHQISGFHTAENGRVVREHRDIYEAVISGDAETAKRIMIGHLGHYLGRRTRNKIDIRKNEAVTPAE